MDTKVRKHFEQYLNEEHGHDSAGVGFGTALFPLCEEKFRVAFRGFEEEGKQLLADVKRMCTPTS